ncbi:M15 family metallopeptidase [Isoptericola jiangsuensis]|uniref:M15 family metallopeptidase n=1 Tax=Isoptericola jiangsuensis TaxID=548579 RepID=UPI003AAB9ECB
MNLPRITLPWLTRRRSTTTVNRRARRGAHRAETPRRRTAPAVPGARTAVGGALAVLALTATTATAVSIGPADAEAEPADARQLAVTGPDEDQDGTDDDPVVVLSQDAAVAEASEAIQRATEVTEDHTGIGGSAEAKITEQADKVADLITVRPQGSAAASRSGERTALDTAPEETTADTGADAGAEASDGRAADELAATRAAATGTAGSDRSPLVDTDATTPTAADDAPSDAADDADSADDTDTADADADASTETDTDTEAAETAATEATEATEATGEDRAELTEATASLVSLLEDAEAEAVDATPAPEKSAEPAEPAEPRTPQEILEAQASAAKKAAENLRQYVTSTEGAGNGLIPADALSEPAFAPGEQLRRDAARQLERLDAAYHARFGDHLDVVDSYRSYDSQVAVKASRGYLAAVPGYSNHGWGVAVDLNGGVETFGTAQYEWLRENGPLFGWDNPDWARSDGRKPEAWHWEYTPLS